MKCPAMVDCAGCRNAIDGRNGFPEQVKREVIPDQREDQGQQRDADRREPAPRREHREQSAQQAVEEQVERQAAHRAPPEIGEDGAVRMESAGHEVFGGPEAAALPCGSSNPIHASIHKVPSMPACKPARNVSTVRGACPAAARRYVFGAIHQFQPTILSKPCIE